jgi:hypothetical protein
MSTITFWTATTVTPDSVTPVAIAAWTEDEAIDTLRQAWDPDGEHDGQEIVEALEAIGYVINVDVHTLPGAILTWDCPDPECSRTDIPETEGECPTCGMANPSVEYVKPVSA